MVVVAYLRQEANLVFSYFDDCPLNGCSFEAMLLSTPDGPCSVAGVGPKTECKEIHASTGTKDTVDRGICGLSDSQSIPLFRQIVTLSAPVGTIQGSP